MQVAAAADADDNPHSPSADHTAGINAATAVPPHNEERREGDLEVGEREMKDRVTENSHPSIVLWRKNMIRDA